MVAARGQSTVYAITDQLARRLATSIGDATVVAATRAPVDLLSADVRGADLLAAARDANEAVLAAKGLPAGAASLLRLRLAHPDMSAALASGVAPLVAAAPTDDVVSDVVAYDRGGRAVLLDAHTVPVRPVLVVEVDTAVALPLGLRVIEDILAGHGLTGQQAAGVTAAGGYWATKVDAIRLSDDKEPWIKGGAEIFNLIGGFGHDGNVRIDTVQMPYLDHDGRTYYPNQLIVHYSMYKYNLADVVMMEDDGDTNYLQLAQAIATALLTIVDGGAYIPLVNAILGAIPGSWWTDDPDFVDAWYTLATSSSGRRFGAAGNGWMDVSPYWVEQL